ncbi:MAG: undecaprenyldiphospho-muramoylpentapeptide beta-N-acetylglucosaminyltransferase [Calditrichaeota bacterium]|nr:undecaprenyldiphospho-muramoylpentapeptide beta-N-acetylglucosaminyltransferase [Calditrichota bacterium]
MQNPPNRYNLPIAIAGGGTGGHAIPLAAIVRELKSLRPGLDALYIGAKGHIEEDIARAEGYVFKAVWIGQLKRRAIFANAAFPAMMVVSFIQAILLLKRHRAQFVVGTGGYSAWPACAAARRLKKPYFLHESNALPGLVTRLLAKDARRVYIGFTEANNYLKLAPEQGVLTGNPALDDTYEIDAAEARRIFNLAPDRPTLLVTGGSGGAQSINRVMNIVKEELVARGWNIIWQVGRSWEGSLTPADKLNGCLHIERFIAPQRMLAAYRAADAAVARCGAMTLTELAAARLPAVLVPYPYAAEGHQEANARAIERAGGGVVVLDNELNPETLFKALSQITESTQVVKMRQALAELTHRGVARFIAEDILRIMQC